MLDVHIVIVSQIKINIVRGNPHFIFLDMDFTKTTVEQISTNIVGIVVYENNQFFANVNNINYPIYEGSNLIGAKKVYSLPNNDYHIPWTERLLQKPELQKDRRNAIKFWGRYKPNMKIKGKIINNIFYDDKYKFSTNTTKPKC